MYAPPTALAVGFLFRTILDPGFQVLHFSSDLFVASRQVPGVQHENQPDETIGQEKIRVHHAAPDIALNRTAPSSLPSFQFRVSLFFTKPVRAGARLPLGEAQPAPSAAGPDTRTGRETRPRTRTRSATCAARGRSPDLRR